MKSIAVDMDGVIANVITQFLKIHAEEFGKFLTEEEITGKPENLAFPNVLTYVNSPGFFRSAPVMEDSQQVLQKLNDHYKIFIVSAATEFPNSLIDKQAWLNEHFPFIGWRQMVFCGSKEIIRADIMIDDHFKNLDYFTGKTFLFTQPHNKLTNAGQHRRVETWKEIETLLLI